MGETIRNLRRNTGWWERHCHGESIAKIAASEGVSVGAVHAGIKAVRDSIPEVEREAIRKDIHALYLELMGRALEIADAAVPPVVAGKDGLPVRDPNDPDVLFRDYGGRLTALETAAKMADRARKMFGVDEATKVQIETGEDEEARRLAAESAAYVNQETEAE